MSNLKFHFCKEAYLNNHPVHVNFQNQKYLLIFSNTFDYIKQVENKDIFSNNSATIDYKYYLDKKEYTEKGIKIIQLKNLCLFKNTSLLNLLNIIGTVLECKTDKLEITNLKKYNFKIPFLVYASFLCVGDMELVLSTNSVLIKDYGNYLDKYIKWYIDISNLLIDNLKIVKQKKLETIDLNYSISNIELMNYCVRPNVVMDIIKAFNNHNSNYIFKRVVIHDSLLDDYYNCSKIQYIKNNVDYNLSTKHIPGKENTLTLYYSLKIDENISLDYIDIYKNGTYKFNFIIRKKMNYDEIKDVIFSFLHTKGEEIFNSTLINECAYSEDSERPIKYTDYEQEFSKVESFYLINDTTLDDIKKVNRILGIDGFESRFSSNSSIMINSTAFIDNNIIFEFEQEYLNKSVLNDNITKIMIIPETHISHSNGQTSIFCNKFTSISELTFNLALLFPFFKYENIGDEKSTGDPVEDILIRLRNIPIKQNLKLLSAQDPKLFGPRTVLKNPRAYSALCQAKEQRPSLITETEYNILKEKIPNSVFNIENQTYSGQRLYMACPYSNFSIANFHHMNNQLCIVRCTTKMSNPGQYEQCSSDLDNLNMIDQKLGHQSHSIIKYNENLPFDRMCKLPVELQAIFPDFICIRADYIMNSLDSKTSENYISYLHRTYNQIPLIIQRSTDNGEYKILTEYEFNQDNVKYCLVIQPESKPELKYLVINVNNYMLLTVNNYPDLVRFLSSINKVSKVYNEIIKYINSKIIHSESIDFENISFYKYIVEIHKKFNIKLIVDNGVAIGLIKRVEFTDYYYQLPQISWPYNDSSLVYSSDFIMKNMNIGSIKFPSIEEIEQSINESDKFCINVKNNKIAGLISKVNDEEIVLLVQEVDYPYKNYENQIEIYDTDYIVYNQLTPLNKIEVKSKRIFDVNTKFELVINEMLLRYVGVNKRFTELNQNENVSKFTQFCQKFGILTRNKTQIVQATSNLISILKTKLNVTEFKNYLASGKIVFNENDVDDIIYKNIIINLQLQHNINEIIEQKAFL